MILTVGNIKGGVGKTTLAVNIAMARAGTGVDVLLIDADQPATALNFTALRNQTVDITDYTAVALTGNAVRTQVHQLAPKYTDVIIDVGGRDSTSFRAALTVSDTLLIPVQPRTFDVWVVDDVSSLLEEARDVNEALHAYAVLNQAEPRGQDNAEAAEDLAQVEGIEYLPYPVIRRKVFANAAAQGRSVMDYKPRDAKAIAELENLVQALYV